MQSDRDHTATAAAAAERRPARELQDAERQPTSFGPEKQVRAADLEPYVGLRYVAKLFRLIAILLLLSMIAAVIQNLYLEGAKSLLGMIPELSQLLVMTGLLWGAGDLALLLIDIGHDVRATRILIGRQAAHPPGAPLVGDGSGIGERRHGPRASEPHATDAPPAL